MHPLNIPFQHPLTTPPPLSLLPPSSPSPSLLPFSLSPPTTLSPLSPGVGRCCDCDWPQTWEPSHSQAWTLVEPLPPSLLIPCLLTHDSINTPY